MIMMKPRKKTNATISTQVRELGSNCSFLDVLRETGARDGGRYTLSVESGSEAYTVLVDRGGPFNAIGGGAAGSRALVTACQLRSGRCTITTGWPVEQPLYQPGLDLTLKAIVEGAVEAPNLPRHRGVESLRNAEWREAYVVQPAQETTWPSDIVAGPISASVPAPSAAVTPAPVIADKPIVAETPAVAETPVVAEAPPVVAETPPVDEPPVARAASVSPVAPAPAPAPAPQPEPHREPKMAWKPVGSASAWLPDNDLPTQLPAADRPAIGKVHPGAAKQLATKALLWLVECDDSTEYTFQQATAMARHGLADGITEMVHPFRRDLDKRISQIKDEWEKSGEEAARAVRKKRARSSAKPADPDPDHEFRLH